MTNFVSLHFFITERGPFSDADSSHVLDISKGCLDYSSISLEYKYSLLFFGFINMTRFYYLICPFNSRNSPYLCLLSALLVLNCKYNLGRDFTLSFSGCATHLLSILHLLPHAPFCLHFWAFIRGICFWLLPWFICKWGRCLNLAAALSSVKTNFRSTFLTSCIPVETALKLN